MQQALVWLSHPLQPHWVISIGKLSPCQAVLARRKSYKDWKGRREDALERVAGVLVPVNCGPQGHRGQGPRRTRLHDCAKQRYCTEQRESLLGFHNPSARLYWGGETAPTERQRRSRVCCTFTPHPIERFNIAGQERSRESIFLSQGRCPDKQTLSP